ncbi:uncharacterized protein LOC100897336 [Galendromus occidentalis]|uniref:Uncharacterized protein LOC100897336 n=1 Tax=Galendromus occidentalis TaxID=34638 RepID=A0AAJ7SF85_9ACAR|nr:uncharacterized protein LOC100897336 [Galendromus occidentalis]
MTEAGVDPSVPDFLNQNTSEAGPEVALFNGHPDTLNFNQNSLPDDLGPVGSYDTRTITKQTFSRLQMNSKFGTFTKKTCESIEKFHSEMNGLDSDRDARSTDNGLPLPNTVERVDGSAISNGSTKEESKFHSHRASRPSNNGSTLSQVSVQQNQAKPSALVSPMMALITGVGSDGQDVDSQTESALTIDAKVHEDQITTLQDELEQLRIQLNDALAERDQGVAALRAYEELLKRINESNAKQKGSSASSLGSGSSPQKDANGADVDKLKKKNSMLEKTVDNLEQTVQDTMARMNEVKDVNQELKVVLTDQQDMLAQYKSTIEQKSFEYRDLLAKHEAHIDALVTEHKRDKALLEKQITLLRAEAHMKSLDNERLASECRIKGEQLARMTEMLNELRQAY